MDSFLEKYNIVNVFETCLPDFQVKIENINNVYHLKYYYDTYSTPHLTNVLQLSSKREGLLGYFEEVENGCIFISCDTTHNWKKFRNMFENDNVVVIGEHLLFLDNKDIEIDRRYYFKNIDNAFYFKSKVSKVSDMYLMSKTAERYFIYRENFYSSSDYALNSYVPEHLFKDVEMTNEHLFMLLSVSNHSTLEQIENTYREKVYKKLLKV